MLRYETDHRHVAKQIVELVHSIREINVPDWNLLFAIMEECSKRSLIVDSHLEEGLFTMPVQQLIEANFLLASSGWVPTNMSIRSGSGEQNFEY